MPKAKDTARPLELSILGAILRAASADPVVCSSPNDGELRDDTLGNLFDASMDGYRKAMTLPAHEFLRRFLQHVPPKGCTGSARSDCSIPRSAPL
jgi:hypothetical protein